MLANHFFISPEHLNTPLTLILYDQPLWKHSVLEKSGYMRTRQMFLSPCYSAPLRCIRTTRANQWHKNTVLCPLSKTCIGLVSIYCWCCPRANTLQEVEGSLQGRWSPGMRHTELGWRGTLWGGRSLADQQLGSGGKQNGGKPLEHGLWPVYPCLLLCPKPPPLFTVAWSLKNLGWLIRMLPSAGTKGQKLLTLQLIAGTHQCILSSCRRGWILHVLWALSVPPFAVGHSRLKRLR